MRGLWTMTLLVALVAGCVGSTTSPTTAPPSTGASEGASTPTAVDDPTAVRSPVPLAGAPTESEPGTIPFHLDISNQNFDEPMVRIHVTLDGTPVIDSVFPVDDQHTWVRHYFFVQPGSHEIVVTAPDHEHEATFRATVDTEHWGSINWWGDAQDPDADAFSWYDSDEEIAYA